MASIRTEIVLVDDDALALEAMAGVLGQSYEVHPFRDAASAERWVEKRPPSLALLDLNLEDASGMETLDAWKRRFPTLEILICSGELRVERAVDCLRRGAADYLVKPVAREALQVHVERALEKVQLKRRLETLGPLLRPHPVELVGKAASLDEVRRKAQLLCGQTQLSVVLLGESGTGKEVVARFLHQQEGDSERPFVVANMPAIPATLMEAELFGVEKGAFTDAKQSRAGKFEMAHGGDIFLDEIGDLQPETQAKLLRTLQERVVERVGGGRQRRLDFRVISATNQSLTELIARGRFREDLMYRLGDMVLWMPPLRERREDIPLLVEHFIHKHGRRPAPRFSDAALARLVAHSWPGNVRQLESTIKRALVFAEGPVIRQVEIFDPSALGIDRSFERQPLAGTITQQLGGYERNVIENALRRHRGDKTATMAELGMSRATFYRKLQQHKIAH